MCSLTLSFEAEHAGLSPAACFLMRRSMNLAEATMGPIVCEDEGPIPTCTDGLGRGEVEGVLGRSDVLAGTFHPSLDPHLSLPCPYPTRTTYLEDIHD